MKARRIPVGWYQLKHQKLRLLAAVAGITFAVILMLVQQGFRQALWVSSVRWHSALEYDLVLVSPKTDFLQMIASFPRNRLVQVGGFEGVRSVTPVYMEQADWRNPIDPANVRKIFVVGFDPSDEGFSGIITPGQHESLRMPDRVLFDSLARPEFGPIADMVEESGILEVEIASRTIEVVGLYQVGTSFGIDGALLTSDLNFQRLFRNRKASNISLGLVKLGDPARAGAMKQRLREELTADVLVLDRDDFKAQEISYWNNNTPIGYVFNFGVVMGLVVGTIIVYQILFSDVQDHLKEYATLKAMGYTNRYLSWVVIQEAVILALLGYIPGVSLATQLFSQAGAATNLPLEMTLYLAVQVLVLTVAMCILSGLIAVRKLKSADPAEVF